MFEVLVALVVGFSAGFTFAAWVFRQKPPAADWLRSERHFGAPRNGLGKPGMPGHWPAPDYYEEPRDTRDPRGE